MNAIAAVPRLLTCLAALAIACLAQPIPGRYIVELAGESAAEAGGASLARRTERTRAIGVQQAAMRRAIEARGGRIQAALDTVLNALIVEAPAGGAWLRALPGVVRVTPDRRVRAKMDRALTLANFPAALALIGAGEAGKGMKIAILDSGIDSSHPGLQDDSLRPPSGFPRADSEANARLTTGKVIAVRSYEALAASEGFGDDGRDANGHGTNAACSAACVIHRSPIGTTIAGMAPKAFLGAYKVLGDDGGGSSASIIKGVEDAVKDGFDVLNLSLGNELAGLPDDDPQTRAVNAAAEAGAIVACAAGNEGPDENSINSPGYADRVISVGSSSSDRALDENGNFGGPIDPSRLSEFSSCGPSHARTIKPDMVSVGDNLLVAASSLAGDGAAYKVTQGTSFATPTVAGAAALLKSARSGLTAAQYRSMLVNSSQLLTLASTGRPAPVRHQGAGRLDILAALLAAVAADPVSVNFGRGKSGEADLASEVTISNTSARTLNLRIGVESYDGRITPGVTAKGPLSIAPGASTTLAVRFRGAGLSGEYQGAILVANDLTDVVARIPYWYAVASGTPASITVFKAPPVGSAGQTVDIFVKVVDRAGLEIAAPDDFRVASMAGGGSVTGAELVEGSPGLIQVRIKLGDSGDESVFRISSGGARRDVTIAVP